jgi:hypothetical protein
MSKLAWLCVVATLSGLGCGAETAEDCPKVPGVFAATYEYQAGSCSPAVPSYAFRVEPEDKGTVTRIETRTSDTVTTKMVFRGCQLSLTQSIASAGARTLRMDADLQVESASSLSGLVTRTEFMPDGAFLCHGVYQADYVRQDLVTGSAVEQSQTVP